MLHHHFPQLISPFHDGFVSGRDIAQFVRANPATKAITSHQAAPPAPTIRGRYILRSILIHEPIARIRASFERWQEYDLPGAREARSSISNATSSDASKRRREWSAIFSCIFVGGAARRANRRSMPSSYKRGLLRSTLSTSSERWSATMSVWPWHNHSSQRASTAFLFP